MSVYETEAWQVEQEGALPTEAVDASLFSMRQSTLTTFAHCPLSARFEIDAGQRHAPQLARGTLAHRCQEEILRTLHRQGERSMPQEEGIAIMYEVLAQQDVPSEDVLTIPPEDELALRQFVIRFCTDWTWKTEAIMALEGPLFADIVCPDGVVRRLTGTPDVLIAEPPETVVIVDAKSGFGVPRTPRDPDPKEPRRYLTERGQGQLDTYGFLVMSNYPAVQYAKLREIHPRVGEERVATLERSDLEHIERLIGTRLMLMDRGLREAEEAERLRRVAEVTEDPAESDALLDRADVLDGPAGIWKAVGGTKQCDWCIRKDLCPRPAAERGGITDLPMAQEYAQDAVALTAKRDQVLKMLKGHVDAAGPIPLPDGRVYGWQATEKDGKVRRSFCAHTPEANEGGNG